MRWLFYFALLPFLAFLSCNTAEPPSTELSIALSIEDVSCTEAWLRLSGTNLPLPANILIMKNSTAFLNITLTGTDTTIYDSTLAPSKHYTYQAGVNNTKSGNVEVITQDISSSNYQMSTWLFGGDAGSCSFDDVNIINENDIWTVGIINMKDSLGKYYQVNAAHWDGIKWDMVRVPVTDFQFTTNEELTSVISFSDSSVWFSSGSSLIKWDGKKFETKAFFAVTLLFMGHINKIWGTDENNIYCVGNNGYIFHYYGTGWKKIDSGTNLRISDIWGDYNSDKNVWEVLAIASDIEQDHGKKIIQILGDQTVLRPEQGLDWYLNALWFRSEKKYYIGGGGIFSFNSKLNEWEQNIFQINYTVIDLKGDDLNNIFLTAGNNLLWHFNGISWVDMTNSINLVNGSVGRLAIKQNLIVTVGSKNLQALILMGRR